MNLASIHESDEFLIPHDNLFNQKGHHRVSFNHKICATCVSNFKKSQAREKISQLYHLVICKIRAGNTFDTSNFSAKCYVCTFTIYGNVVNNLKSKSAN